jgi:hypothetical protein
VTIFEACVEYCEQFMLDDEVLVSCQDYCSEMEDIEAA